MKVSGGRETHAHVITIDLDGAQKRDGRAAQPIVRYAVAQQALKGEVSVTFQQAAAF